MDKRQIVKDYERLFFSKEMNDTMESLTRVCDLAMNIIVQHAYEDRTQHKQQHGYLLFQMYVLRARSILQSGNGIAFNFSNGNSLKVLDPFSAYTLVRSLFEAFCTFNNIYLKSKSEEEMDLKHLIWVVSGLKERQKFNATTTAHQAKKELEALEISEHIATIKSNSLYQALVAGGRDNVDDAIKRRNWKLVTDGSRAHCVSWQALWNQAVPNGAKLDEQYTALSLNAHPSYVSVFQFGSMYRDKMEEFNVRLAFELSTFIISFFIRDYCTYFPVCLNVFNKGDNVTQLLINNYNAMFRGEEYQLNDLKK